ncbi:DUF2157 domain-containing protein [Gloeocapsopsis sp. IPPAS B-1203]|uniref:DUF2157 domain-containing protein n=1 Tax=Gloeocapsopsis sp. IPPAS B-1203 TaxID=2049454 RepID=UPI000C17A6E4|nr:DUF2157 domain-containing protein [Gloeocapsopsis sp. IPPAS B-1203]PIG91768.1 hypothetical protein CSQ79_19705 [Gloeocapsopsis sp. IPPAS B-1203]
MTSDKFRHQLRHEAQIWQAEGLINDLQYEQLSQRYQFNTLDSTASHSFIAILVGLGSILIGLGIITFVAANWQELPRGGKVTLLLSLFIGVNIVGFWLWKHANESRQRLGHGLLLLGALILGANMGLMGQIFHIDAPFYELLLAWGIGVLAMAYSLRLTSLGVLSIILLWLGYWGYWGSAIAQSWSTSTIAEISWSSIMGQHMPLLSAVLFMPLAYWCRSGWIFALGAIAIVTSLEANIQPFVWGTFQKGWVASIAFALPPALLWSYDDSFLVYGNFLRLYRHRDRHINVGSFQPIARNLALFTLGILFIFAATTTFWQSLAQYTEYVTSRQVNQLLLIDAVILTGIAIGQWVLIASQRYRRRQQNVITMVVGIFICIIATVTFWHIEVTNISPYATFIFNIMLFLFAAGLIRIGLDKGGRRAFWGGMLLLSLRIFYVFLLSATGLLFKSLVFILCGIGVMAVGLWFERHIRLNHPAKS